MFLLNATKSCLTLKAGEMLVAGSVNVHEVKFEFSDDWSDLVKTVTFRTVSDSRSVILNEEGECIIPWEVLKDSSPYLYVGLIGTRDAEVVLPTIWADLGEVRNGTEPGADVTDPTPTVYEQVLSELGSRANNLKVKDEKLQLRSGETVLSEVELPKQEAAEPGTTDHTALLNRDLPDQHPMSAITGLEEALKEAGADSWEDIGEDKQTVEVLGEVQLTNDEERFIYGGDVPSLVAGDTYLVNLNGTNYETAAQDLTALYGVTAFGLGDFSSIGFLGNGEPFLCIMIPGAKDGEIMCQAFDGSTSVTISIKQEQTTITPIPTEYLPTTVPVIPTATVGQTIVVKAVDESGKPTEWEAAELPEQVQGDWNVNDESDPAFVKNRPFYSYTETTVTESLLASGTYTSESMADYGGAFMALVPTDSSVANSTLHKYDVSLDGVKYRGLEIVRTDAGHFLGNVAILAPLFEAYGLPVPDDTGEPFVLQVSGDEAWYSVLLVTDLTQSTTHDVSLMAVLETGKEVVVKLPRKFYDSAGAAWLDDFGYVRGEILGNYEENVASGGYSLAEGNATTASGAASHAEGVETTASGDFSHAEGNATTASGDFSHAEGRKTTASGNRSHAEGFSTIASGVTSHAEGNSTIAASNAQHAQGKHNIEDREDKYAHIVGNGTSEGNRSNAHTLDWNGLGWFAGGLKVGGTGQDDENAVAVLTAADMDTIAQSVIAKLPIYNGEVEEV